MAISRAQLAKELEPGLNVLFGMEYDRYDAEHAEIYETESSDRAFEEEVMLVGFGNAQTKSEGAGVQFDSANEAYTARYTHETIALAFALTEEAMEDNLYDRLGARYTRALARSMAHTKQVTVATTGTIVRVAAGDNALILGVFNGCRFTDPTTGKETFSNHYPASTNASDIEAFVIDAPHAQYEIQADAAFPVADLFGNFDIVDATAGSTISGTSRMELDVTTGATTAALALKAIDISTDPENSDVGSANTNVVVVINNHLFSAGTVGLA